MTLLKQFQTITFHRVFVDITGSINAALMLSNAIYWTNRLPPERDGWFYKTKEEWEQETGLTREQQDKARKQLLECGLIETRRAKIPDGDCTTALWFRIDLGRLDQCLNGGDQKREIHDCQKREIHATKSVKPAFHSFYTSTTSSIPPPPRGRAREKFPLSPTWTPADAVYPVLHESGISPEFAANCLPEFRVFWRQRGDARDNWESVFIRHVRNEFAYRKQREETAHDRSTTRQGLSGRPASSRRETISERLERYERFIAGDDDDPGNAPNAQRGPISGEFIRH